MPRRRRARKVVEPPSFKGYKPYGSVYNRRGAVELFYEEYEAIKLSDYNLLTHNEACKLMDVSRPTFARIYESARRKIAKALVEGKEIVSVYGNAHLENDWFKCQSCNSKFTLPNKEMDKNCPLCGSGTTERMLHKKA
jgi:predicted DNA-binding protein (UPF0251 family)